MRFPMSSSEQQTNVLSLQYKLTSTTLELYDETTFRQRATRLVQMESREPNSSIRRIAVTISLEGFVKSSALSYA